MTFNEFYKKYMGKGIDYDGAYGVQCFDLANQYCKCVIGCKPFTGLYAHQIYTNFENQPNKSYFTRIANTPDFIPQAGDIVVWASSLNGSAGHVAICTGVADKQHFHSIDQNWTGRNDPVTVIDHNYNHVLGVLRPKDQSKITGKKSAPFTKNKNYTLTANVKVRTGAGTNYPQKFYSDLTADAKKHALSQTPACLKSGTVVTVSDVKKKSDKEYWGKIPSGWIALMYNGTKYVK